MKRVLSLFGFVLAVGIGPAFSESSVAVLSGLDGRVLVNQGEGYKRATDNMALRVNDQIMVGDEGAAVITYSAADCTVTAAPQSMITIESEAPCVSGTAAALPNSVMVTPAQFAGTDDAASTRATIVAVTFLAAGAAAFILSNEDDNGVSAVAK